MLQITARLFKDGQLVGYRLTDGTQTQDLTKIQAWMYAKNKQIINVTATGTQDDPQLSGINGFKLKELPEVKFGQPAVAPLIKLADTKQDIKVDIQKEFNSESEFSGEDLEVVAVIVDDALGAFAARIDGYAVRNRGNNPIEIDRIAYGKFEKYHTITLNSGETAYLSRAEVNALGNKRGIYGELYNAKLIGTSKKMHGEDKYTQLQKFFFIKPMPDGTKLPEIYTWDVISEEDIVTYFGSREKDNKYSRNPMRNRGDLRRYGESIGMDFRTEEERLEDAYQDYKEHRDTHEYMYNRYKQEKKEEKRQQTQQSKGFFGSVADTFNRFKR